MLSRKYHIPIRLPSLSNCRMTWRALARVKRDQRIATIYALIESPTIPRRHVYALKPPFVVTITRIGPRKLDGDNLQGACKYVRDTIADVLGLDDGSPLYTWLYEQRQGDYGVDVEIAGVRSATIPSSNGGRL